MWAISVEYRSDEYHRQTALNFEEIRRHTKYAMRCILITIVHFCASVSVGLLTDLSAQTLSPAARPWAPNLPSVFTWLKWLSSQFQFAPLSSS